MAQISKNFTLEEMIASDTAKARGIINVPNTQQLCNLCGLVNNVLQPLRSAMGRSIDISSGFRCKKLNIAVGGVSNSQHMTGEAADINIHGDKMFGRSICEWIRRNCQFDQLIWEHNAAGTYWVHVSYKLAGGNRKQYIDNLLKR